MRKIVSQKNIGHSSLPPLYKLLIFLNTFSKEKFILRYGTHVVVSAKFGGEFKIMHTMRKSKKSSLDQFAQQCTSDSLKTFSRSFDVKGSFAVPFVSLNGKAKVAMKGNATEAKENKNQNEKSQM